MTINVYTHVMDEFKRKEAAKFSLFSTYRTAEKYTYKKSCVGENRQKTAKNKRVSKWLKPFKNLARRINVYLNCFSLRGV